MVTALRPSTCRAGLPAVGAEVVPAHRRSGMISPTGTPMISASMMRATRPLAAVRERRHPGERIGRVRADRRTGRRHTGRCRRGRPRRAAGCHRAAGGASRRRRTALTAPYGGARTAAGGAWLRRRRSHGERCYGDRRPPGAPAASSGTGRPPAAHRAGRRLVGTHGPSRPRCRGPPHPARCRSGERRRAAAGRGAPARQPAPTKVRATLSCQHWRHGRSNRHQSDVHARRRRARRARCRRASA